MLNWLLSAWAWLNDYALAMFGAGMVAVALFNLRQWRADRARALQIRARPVAPVHLNATPRVTILAAAWNEAEHMAAHLQSVCALRYPNKEYILCAGGPDGTYALACRQSADWMKVLEQQSGEGKQRALRRGLSLATGDIVFLTDADCLLTDDAFERTLAQLINEGEAVATGASEPLPAEQNKPLAVERWFIDRYVQARTGPYTSGLLGGNAALTRQALHATGNLQAEVTTGTDYYLAKQVLACGHRIRFVAASIVATEYPCDWHSYWQRQSRWLRNVVTHGLHFRAYAEVVSCLMTSAVGLAMLMGGGIAAWQAGVLLAGWGVIYAHALAGRARYMRFGELITGRRFPAYQLLPFTLLADFGIWALAGLQYLVPAWRKRW